MNEQTKSLAMQYAHKMGNSVLYNAERMEAFAQLIIQECAGLVRDDDNAYDILKHFGVEE